MPNRGQPTVTPQLVVGIGIMLFGVSLALDRLGILDAGRTFRLWPAATILLGAWVVMRRHDRRGRRWGFIWIIIGTWLLLNNLGVVGVRFWELVWPLAIVLLGVNLVMQTLRRRDESPGSGASETGHDRFTSATDAGKTVALFAVLGESKRICSDTPFRGGEMTALMGGCHLDLQQATIAPNDEAIVDVFAIMGGLELRVPSNWTVVSHVIPFMGGVDDKRLPIEQSGLAGAAEARPRLVLRGFVMMGALVIKN
jgi:hypothetical protein